MYKPGVTFSSKLGICNFSGVLPHEQTTCSKVTTCNLKDCKHEPAVYVILCGNWEQQEAGII